MRLSVRRVTLGSLNSNSLRIVLQLKYGNEFFTTVYRKWRNLTVLEKYGNEFFTTVWKWKWKWKWRNLTVLDRSLSNVSV